MLNRQRPWQRFRNTALLLTVALVFSLAAPPAPAQAGAFADTAGHWATEEIGELRQRSIVGGYADGLFRPANPVTRAEFFAMVNRAMGYYEEAGIGFSDVSEEDWFYPDVARAIEAGYLSGYPDGTMRPHEPIRRQEAAYILAAIRDLSGRPAATEGFSDSDTIPGWSRDAIGAVTAAGFMGGFPDQTFRPAGLATRAETAVLLYRVLTGGVWVLDTPGVHGPEEGIERLEGTLTIRAPGTTLRNTHLTGDLIIGEDVGEGEVTLDNVTVDGNLYVRGGGSDSIYILGGSIQNIIIEKAGGALRIVLVHDRGVSVLVTPSASNTEIILEGFFGKVEIRAGGVTIRTQGNTRIGELAVGEDLDDVSLDVGSGTIIEEMQLGSAVLVDNGGTITEALGTGADDSTYTGTLPVNMQPTPSRRTPAPSDPIAERIAAGWIPVATPEDLNAIRANAVLRTFGGDSGYSRESTGGPAQRYIQVADIDLGVAPWNTGDGWIPIGETGQPFTGEYDGNGFQISNLTIARAAADQSLFGRISGASVKNVDLSDADVQGSYYTGALIGRAEDSTVEGCRATGTVTDIGEDNGGLIGRLDDSTVRQCHFEGTVTGNYAVGGLVGISFSGTISLSSSSGTVNTPGKSVIGGLVGYSRSGTTIVESASTAEVIANGYCGGLVGVNDESTIESSFASGPVQGTAGFVGGLVGQNDTGTIRDSYATGNVTGNDSVGGIAGQSANGLVQNSYSASSVAGLTNAGGLYGTLTSGVTVGSYHDQGGALFSVGNTGDTSFQRSTESMLQQATFETAGWDFDDTWTIQEGTSYPYLQWQGNEDIPGLFAAGLGTPGDPWQIASARQLNHVRFLTGDAHSDKHFLLTGDIGLGAAPWNTGEGWDPIGDPASPFAGTFDGGDRTISHLTINRTDSDHGGLFGVTAPGSVIRRTRLASADIASDNRVGILAAENHGTIEGCQTAGAVLAVNATPTHLMAGGLVGENRGTILESHSTASVRGSRLLGGLVGINEGSITDSWASGTVTDHTGWGYHFGGLVGWNTGNITRSHATGDVAGYWNSGGLAGVIGDGQVTASYASGAVSGRSMLGGLAGNSASSALVSASYATGDVNGAATGEGVGGLIGSNSATVQECFASGNVTGGTGGRAGGLVGWNRGPVLDSYATGDVASAGMRVGGLVGDNDSSEIHRSFSTGAPSGTSDVGGLIGRDQGGVYSASFWDQQASGLDGAHDGAGNAATDPDGITGLLTLPLTQQATFLGAGWDLVDTWTIQEEQSYPYLLWQNDTNVPVPAPPGPLLDEDFSGGVVPPAGWTSVSLGTLAWGFDAAEGAAQHNYDGSGYCDSWLITPLLDLQTGVTLSFRQKGDFSAWYEYHGIWVSVAGNDPTSGDFAELVEIGAAPGDWAGYAVDLSAYTGQTVYLAFVYRGTDADRWWVDAVVVE